MERLLLTSVGFGIALLMNWLLEKLALADELGFLRLVNSVSSYYLKVHTQSPYRKPASEFLFIKHYI